MSSTESKNQTPASSSTRILSILPDDPINSTITDEASANIIYTVRTKFSKENRGMRITTVQDDEGKIVADWEWRDSGLAAQMLRFRAQGERKAANEWLKHSMLPMKTSVVFKDGKGREFRWKRNNLGTHLQLFTSADAHKPIAQFVPPALDPQVAEDSDLPNPSKLILESPANEIMDEVVVSWALLEALKRAKAMMKESKQLLRALSGGITTTTQGVLVPGTPLAA